jgi:hypothetical protein
MELDQPHLTHHAVAVVSFLAVYSRACCNTAVLVTLCTPALLHLQTVFEHFGPVEDVITFPGRMYAFVNFVAPEDGCRAAEALNDREVGGELRWPYQSAQHVHWDCLLFHTQDTARALTTSMTILNH